MSRCRQWATVLALAATPVAVQPSEATTFREITQAAGIDFVQESAPEKKYILESMSGGVAVLDYDGDGHLDIYLVNSLTVETADKPETAPSALYRNLGDGTYEDVAVRAGVAFPGWGMGACAADIDGDDQTDLYVTGVDVNRLYRNRGDGTFEEIASTSGVAAGGWSTGCGFADYDRDGDLDLFVSRYVKMDLDDLPVFGRDKTCQYRGILVQCGPRGLPGTSDFLFRNEGDGTFTEVSEAAGVSDPEGLYGLGVAWVDLDEDGWLDLFVANDANPNLYYRNRGDGTFEESAFFLGLAASEDGSEQGCMGVAVGDPRNLGKFDLFITNFSEEYNILYQNEGDFFTDASFRSRTAASSLPYVGWGTAFLDFDNDGWLDLIAVNGHVYPQLANANLGASASYRQRKLLYRNRGDGTFQELGAAAGEALGEERVSRGLAVGDFDIDGKLDLIVNDLDGAAQLLENVEPSTGNWLSVRLEGTGDNRDAVGAQLAVTTGKLRQIRLVRSGTSYLSQSDLAQHFGLGTAERIDLLEVTWPDGSVSRHHDLPVNRQLTLSAP